MYNYSPLCRYWITLYRYVLVFIVPHVDIELEDNKQFISNIPRMRNFWTFLFAKWLNLILNRGWKWTLMTWPFLKCWTYTIIIRSEHDHECAISKCSIALLCKVLWTWKPNKEKGNGDTVPFSLFAVCTVEIWKPIVLCLEVKIAMNALYVNVPNHFVSKMN